MGVAKQSRLLEQAEQFKDDDDNDNYSDYIEDASVHAVANTRAHVRRPAFVQTDWRVVSPIIRRHRGAAPEDQVLYKPEEAVNACLWPYVLRLDPAQLPRTSARTEVACQYLHLRRIHRHPSVPAIMVPKVCWIFEVYVRILSFVNSCLSVFLLPLLSPL